MNTSRKLALCGIAAALVSAVACSKVPEQRPNTARYDYAAPPSEAARSTAPVEEPRAAADATNLMPASRTRSAAEQIAQSRCEREKECGNIGPNKTFSSSQDCLARIQNDWKEDLSKRQCPGGINQRELNNCLQQVRTESCANPFDTLARITECTSAQICIAQP